MGRRGPLCEHALALVLSDIEGSEVLGAELAGDEISEVGEF